MLYLITVETKLGCGASVLTVLFCDYDFMSIKTGKTVRIGLPAQPKELVDAPIKGSWAYAFRVQPAQ